MLKIIWYSTIASMVIALQSCVPSSDAPLEFVKFSPSDPTFQRIANFQNAFQLDSLRSQLNSNDPSIRKLAVDAFGSIKDQKATSYLVPLLNDQSLEVKTSVARSLGLLKDSSIENVLVNAFVQKDTSNSVNNTFNQAILESIGQIGSKENLIHISNVNSYLDSDNHLLLGQAKSIYNFALRDIYDQSGSKRMMDLLTTIKIPDEVKIVASNYFYRAKNIDIEPYKFQLGQLVKNNKVAEIRMAAAASLAKSNNRQIQILLLDQLEKEPDYRVRCNIIRALGSYNYQEVKEVILTLLVDKNIHVAKSAAEYFYLHGIPSDTNLYRELVGRDINWEVKSKLYQAILRHVPNSYKNTRVIAYNEIKARIVETSNEYEQAEYIKAAAEDVLNYNEVYNLAKGSQSNVVKTALVNGIQSMLSSPKWPYAYNTRAKDRYAKRQIASILEEIIKGADAGQMAVGASILADSDHGFDQLNIDFGYLDSIKLRIPVPEQLETYNFVVEANNFLNGKQDTEAISTKVNTIDWSLLSDLSDTTNATIKTTKGDIQLHLLPVMAPATVSNFIRLAQDNFFDGKVFHRVVPNFVIQGGCPRGDGYGSLDYTIPSETSQSSYITEGVVGMASAGKHTESCQFFITHSPALHLDGNYTQFANVIDGMNVVNDIQLGDKIIDVLIDTI